MPEERVGRVSNYFSRIGVAAVQLSASLKIGDTVRFRGSKTDFSQVVESMEIERRPVAEAGAGASVGIKVREKVRPNDEVYKVT